MNSIIKFNKYLIPVGGKTKDKMLSTSLDFSI